MFYLLFTEGSSETVSDGCQGVILMEGKREKRLKYATLQKKWTENQWKHDESNLKILVQIGLH